MSPLIRSVSVLSILVLFNFWGLRPIHAANPKANSSDSKPSPKKLKPVTFGVDLAPGAGTSSAMNGSDRRQLSLNFIGYSGAIDGVEFGMIGNINRYYMKGLQVSGMGNITNGAVRGLQLAGVGNVAGLGVFDARAEGTPDERQSLGGLQIAGSLNLAIDSIDASQLAGVANVTTGSLEGTQLSGAANVSVGHTRGTQVAGASNVSVGRLKGVQVSGATNLVAGDIVGGQLAGGINIATGEVSGVQLGVVNVAKNSDFSLGIANIFWDGRFNVDIWGNETGFAYAGVQNGGDYFQYTYFGGIRPIESKDETLFSAGLGLGAHLPIDETWSTQVNLMASSVSTNESFRGNRQLSWLEFVAIYQPITQLAVEVGPTYRIFRNDTETSHGLAPFSEEALGDSGTFTGWPGLKLGISLL